VKKWNTRKSAAENARRRLPEMARAYFQEGSSLSAETTPNAQMHEFRLSTKAFRYTLELFLPVYGPALKNKLEEIKKVQQILGALQDCETVLAARPRDAKLTAYAEERMRVKRDQFFEYWTMHFASPANQAKWNGYLSRPVKKTGKD